MDTFHPFTLNRYFGTLTIVRVVPLSEAKFTPGFPSLEIFDALLFGVGQRTDLFRNLSPRSVSLPVQLTHSRLDYGQLR